MADKVEGDTSSGRSRSASPSPDKAKPETAKPKRKAETPTVTDDLTGKFLRVGNALYRTSDDKKPIARLEPDRLKTSKIDALPDIVRIAKATRTVLCPQASTICALRRDLQPIPAIRHQPRQRHHHQRRLLLARHDPDKDGGMTITA